MNRKGENTLGFAGIVISLILVVLVGSLYLSFALDVGREYGRNASEIEVGGLNLSLFEESVNTVDDSAENYREQFETGANIEDVDDAQGIFSIISDLYTMITTPFRLLASLGENLFHVSPIVTNVLLGILSILLIYYSWRAIRRGD